MRGNRIFILIPVLVLLSLSLGLFIRDRVLGRQQSGEKEVFIVELKEDGFHPREFIIPQNTTVRFISKLNSPFWPASDPHPTHTDYPAFDPKRPLKPQESWSFLFTRAGQWNYHDHFSPAYTGAVIIQERGPRVSSSQAACGKNGETCVGQTLQIAFAKFGLEGGLAVLDTFSSAGDCHWYAHQLGALAYEKWRYDRSLAFDEHTALCEYGFWHGFLGELTLNEGPPEARRFCESIPHTSSIADNCYHGLGLGAIQEPPDETLWGDPRALAESGIKTCEQFGDEGSKRTSCISGVFHAEIDFAVENKYGLSFNKNPLVLCDTQRESYRKECYLQLAPRFVHNVPGVDIMNVLGLFRGADRLAMDDIIRAAMHAFTQKKDAKDGIDYYIAACRNIPKEVKTPCLEGAIEGSFTQMLYKGSDVFNASQFCRSELFLEQGERLLCYRQIVAAARYMLLSQDKIKSICESIEEKQRKEAGCGID